MKAPRLILVGIFLALVGGSLPGNAEDIDIYAIPRSSKNAPNILIVVDNVANANDSAPSCSYDLAGGTPGSGGGGTPSMNGTVLGMEQCALYNLVNALPTTTANGALVNIGIMVYNGTNLDKNLGLSPNTCPGNAGGCLIRQITPMDGPAKSALMTFIQGWTTTTFGASGERTASVMQEAWAYFAGQIGISGRNYQTIQPTISGCVNDYVVFIGNAYGSAGHPADPSSTPTASTLLTGLDVNGKPASLAPMVAGYPWALNAWLAAGGAKATGLSQPTYPGMITIPSGTYGVPPANNSCGSYSMGNNPTATHSDPSGLYADEWARFMRTTSLIYNNKGSKQSITTYTIGLMGPQCQADYVALLTSMAMNGGGKFFAATNGAEVFQSIFRVTHEAQAVASVFASSSLPVSVNAQGTYLNQIYIGMFRPEQNNTPRWYGNLKQYQFIYNPTTNSLQLGDAAGFQAVSAAGTGLLSPSIASFWTCANAGQLATASTLLGQAYGQWSAAGPGRIPLCSNDPAAGYWARSLNGIGAAFDVPDGDIVEKGGHAQMLRLTNLSDTYTAPPGSAANSRKLYTYCPAGAACVAALSDPRNVFDTSNAAITDAMLGTGPAPNTTRDTLTRWVRGEDNLGDEPSLCPPGSTPGAAPCPNPAVNIRPKVHGDVLHSRPVVINYGGTIVNITSTSDSGTTRTATASTADIATLSALGTVVPVAFSTGNICAVTIASSTTFTYSTTNCSVTGAQSVSAGTNNIVIFYGGNDGVFRAIDGNQPTYTYIDPNKPANKTTISDPNAGQELWGFIPPEFFGKLKRLRDDSPLLLTPTTAAGVLPTPARKDYFADGATAVYQAIDGNGKTLKAIIYITMRRGGRFMYAIDVTNPNNPTVVWRRSQADAGFAEMGQTWSLPKVAKIKGWPNPVLIFGAGYSPDEDSEAPKADTMGRGIFILDAFSGQLVWNACGAGCSLNVPGMVYSIPADLTLVDRNNDGNIDRVYATDVGGNVWRMDLEPPAGNTPANWQVNKLAALGCNAGVCPAGTTPRKFLYPAEVVATNAVDYVFVASGDREHPLYTDPTSTTASPNPYLISPAYAVSSYAVTNRAYMLKDLKTGMDGSNQTLMTEASLFDCTACAAASPYPGTLSGYYITMQPGEKSVNAPLVVYGLIFFGTNQAQAPNQNQCEEGLGEATGYRLNPFTGILQKGEFENGGLPPSPVAGVVNIIDPVTGKIYQKSFCLGCGGVEDSNTSGAGDCNSESSYGNCLPPVNVKPTRSRLYWYRTNK